MNRSVSKQISELLSTGTPKQKAIILCKRYIDRESRNIQPLITEAEAKAIRDSITTDEAKEFNKWIGYYNTFISVASMFALTCAEYKAEANKLLAFIQQWEDYTNEENHLNSILQNLKETGSKEAIEAFYEAVSYITFDNAKVRVDEDGYIVVDLGDAKSEKGFFGSVKKSRAKVVEVYSVFKSSVIAIEEWISKRRCKAIIPDFLLEAIEDGKSDYALLIAPQYSHNEVLKKKKEGIKVNAYEEARAIFPSYEEIPIREEYYNLFKNKFEKIESRER